MNVYWLQQTIADLPDEDTWLSSGESARLEAMRFPKRRNDWRLGRWTAKRALATWLHLQADPAVLARLELRPAASGAPQPFLGDKPIAVAISMSHSGGSALCTVSLAGVSLGCDLEQIEPRSDAFVADYFTPREQAWVARTDAAGRARLLAVLWSAKESALKALQTGLRLDTRAVDVHDGENSMRGWNALQVRCRDGRDFHGWWQQAGGLVRTVVADPAPYCPVPLRIETHSLATTWAAAGT